MAQHNATQSPTSSLVPWQKIAATSLLSLTLATQAIAANGPVIDTQSGAIQGKSLAHTNAWLGIPYAEPPVGKLRWQPPQTHTAWSSVKKTTTFGNVCMQTPPPVGPEASLKNSPMSEDCLTLNVWQPKDDAAQHAPYPVMVWIHGGAFRLGSSSLPLYNGANVARHGVIVVTMNYRLGPFSVLAHPALNQGHKAMNMGLLDQIAALKWVKHNIAQFGGDANNVTIWGESAGGASVGYLLTSPLAKGLFNKAIMESGALSLPEFSREQAISNAQHQLSQNILTLSAQQLRALPAKKVLALPLAKTATMPVIDGVSLTQKSQRALALGDYNKVPLLIGSNNYEAGFFPAPWAASLPGKLGSLWPEAKKLTDGYGTKRDDLKAAQLATDIFATLPTRHFADSSVHSGMPTWRYYFSYVSPAKRSKVPGAIHTAEIPYVFSNLSAELKNISAADKQLAQTMTNRWVHFAKTGNPNPPSLPHWPQWNPAQATLWSIGNTAEQAISEPGAKRLQFLSAHNHIQMN